MGDLSIAGLDAPSVAHNKARWPIAPGAPLDLDAVRSFRFEYLRGAGFHRYQFRLQEHADSDLVNVEYTFQ